MADIETTRHIDDFLIQTDNIHLKLWAIIGNNPAKTKKIISYLKEQDWKLIDVGQEIIKLPGVIMNSDEPVIEIGEIIKEWMNALPDNLILTNASILYEKKFNKITPIGAFKYGVSRTKHCVLILENETLVSNRIYYGKVGQESYSDKEEREIVLSTVAEIAEDYNTTAKTKKQLKQMKFLLMASVIFSLTHLSKMSLILIWICVKKVQRKISFQVS